ncbi:zf-HC2 domain-containing protein [Arthrobacter zhangbolii]|uniref:Zf-HC2 domain-containing protein n=1 Tax=Arthrobacter zhangbolii TaxID=2886936 RepID=A0A9X1S9T3_9MICC|nr:zf-HC2 domain-containing protein [Arthrobacter zhangbolii]MCC3273940.1 zf-HC2 domain-containing protein [Arthrobacter zhangbolii]UON91325.1 zf-HC2 domain-containing protein [Arthrobacter zhangbolii]
MRHPTRHLRDYIDAEMPPRRMQAIEAHLSRCALCRARVAEERRLRSRLRSLRVPGAGPELKDRINLSVASAAAGAGAGTGTGTAPPEPGLDGRSHVLPAAGAVAAAGAVLLAGAYFAGTLLEVPAVAGTPAAMAAGWHTVTRGSDTLGQEQLASLRAHGWSCPEFADLGLTLESARSLEVAGRPAVEMRFTGNGEQIRLVEQHPLPGEDRQPVINAVSGRAVAADGFRVTGSTEGPAVFGADGNPGQTVIAAGSVTYTFESTLPVKTLPRAVEEISVMESARLDRPPAEPEPMERIVRGLAVFSRTGWAL